MRKLVINIAIILFGLFILTNTSIAQVFPVKISSNSRYLVDQNDAPFLVVGDYSWNLVAQLTYAQADQYLTDRATRGFNTIWVGLTEKYYADNSPNNIYDTALFTGAVFATPNEAYFALADSILSRARQLGFLIYLSPTSVGWLCGVEGWCTDIQAASTATMKTWGAYVGNRYKTYPNIVWVIGGDADPNAYGIVAKLDSMVAGIKSTDNVYTHLFTAHSTYGVLTTYFTESWVDLNGTYTWTPSSIVTFNDAAYDVSPTKPTLFYEGFFENENSSTTQQLRAQAYWSVFRGGFGHIFGNLPIWTFGSSVVAGDHNWVAQLGSAGSVSMIYFKNVISALHWYKFVPDRTGSVITAGALTGTSLATFVYTTDSTSIAGYLPTQRAVTIDPARMKGDSIRVKWYNPGAGTYTDLGNFSKISRSYTPAAAGDWVLVITEASPVTPDNTFTLGETVPNGTNLGHGNGCYYRKAFLSTINGTTDSIYIYVNWGAGTQDTIYLSISKDSTSNSAALLWQSNPDYILTNSTPSWHALPVSIDVDSGTVYWLGYGSPTGNSFNVYTNATNTANHCQACLPAGQGVEDGWPNPLPTCTPGVFNTIGFYIKGHSAGAPATTTVNIFNGNNIFTDKVKVY